MGVSLQGRFNERHQASCQFVAAPWPPNERQIKAKIYLQQNVATFVPHGEEALLRRLEP
jgi:hypothetical protein